MSQPKKKEYKECFTCKKNGYPDVKIDFLKTGEDPQTGKTLWRLMEPDGTTVHKHVTTPQEFAALKHSSTQTEPPEGQAQLQIANPNAAYDMLWIKKELNELHRKMNLCMDALNIDPEQITPPNDPNNPQDTYDQH